MIRVFNVFVPKGAVLLMLSDALLLAGIAMLGMAAAAGGLDTLIGDGGITWSGALVLDLVFVSILYATGLYERRFLVDFRQTVLRAAAGAVLLLPVLLLVGRIVPVIGDRMATVVLLLGATVVGVLASRHLYVALLRNGMFRSRVVVVDTGGDRGSIDRVLQARSAPRLCLVDVVRLEPGSASAGQGRLEALCRDRRVDEVVTTRVPDDQSARRTLAGLRRNGVRVIDHTAFLERELKQLDVDNACPDWVLYSGIGAAGRMEAWAKRLLDLAAAGTLFLFTLPLLLVTALAIKLEDGGPVLYRQERVGLNGRTFQLLKFRSMRVDAEKDGVARWAAAGDPRVTLVGRIIRAVRIDEIPQVLNVVRGEMSFVGPRPERPGIVADLEKILPAYGCRHLVPPGITGWAQVNYPYGASVEDAREKLRYDLYYVKNRNLMLDLLIIVQTVRVVLFSEGAR